MVAVTAWQAIFDEARLSSGQAVLIHGAAGNVGAFAVQFAREAGLRIITTARARDIATVRRLGAEDVIDFGVERFEEKASPVDAVIDLVGGEVQERSFSVLKPGGVLVSAVSQPDQKAAERHGVKAHFFLVKVTTELLARIAVMIDAGKLRTNIGAVLSLAEARDAHEMLEGNRPHPLGKIVIQVMS